jgi:hypothetical protein
VGNFGGSFKGGHEDREGAIEMRDFHLRSMLRREQEFPHG